MQGTAKFVLIARHTVQILQTTGIHSVYVLYIHVHAMSISGLIVTHIYAAEILFSTTISEMRLTEMNIIK